MSKAEAAEIVRRLRKAGFEAFWVGGSVRDLIRGVEPQDFDIVTSARPQEVQALFSRTVPVGARFGVILVIEKGEPYEVATFRKEADYLDGRRPNVVSFATAKEDVLRRDFTINGLLMDPETGEIVDYVGGRADLAARTIRTIGDPDERFGEDHLRMLRAVRFAATLGFVIEPLTFAAIARRAAAIGRISSERVREELTKLLAGGGARDGLELLEQSGLLMQLLPEAAALKGVDQPPAFHPEGDVWEHTLRMLALLPAGTDPRLAWAVLLHDVGKPATRFENETGVHFYGHDQKGAAIAATILQRLRFSNAETETILALVAGHMGFMDCRRMRPNRLKRFLRMPDFSLHLELHRLDCLASHGVLAHYDFCKEQLAAFPAEELQPRPLLSGRDLIALGYRPGPLFKEILTALEDAQLAGEIRDADEARALVQSRWGLGK
ncbi:MAG: CCA tRNA nucleotidyltransferase [Deltaproteobacteria bacterium]|nr:CCA tRNA nucleotidyltransferase [Deltaproteobacteria bacterium]